MYLITDVGMSRNSQPPYFPYSRAASKLAVCFAVLFLLAIPASAKILHVPKGVDVQGWQIEYSSPSAIAKFADKRITGTLSDRQGDFSLWTFRSDSRDPNNGFEVIFNEKTGVVISFKPALEAGGPFLNGVSADGQLIALDFGTGPMERGVEVWDCEGRRLLKDRYLYQMKWDGNTLIYLFPEKSLDLDLNQETRRCKDVGAAWLVKKKRFTRQAVEVLGSKGTVQCSN